jgi:hypothetical protein
VPHLARCRYHALPVQAGVVTDRAEWWAATAIDESVQRDSIELLWPMAIDAAEKFLRFYFSPRLEVVPTGLSQFELRNLSSLPLHFDADDIRVVYGDDSGARWPAGVDCGDDSVELAPAGQPGSTSGLDCTLGAPQGPEPALADDFWVVVRGTLGERGVAADSADYDAGTAPFVVAFDHVQPTIVFDRIEGDGQGTPPNTDVPRKHDVYTVAIDPLRPLEEGELGSEPVNRTDPIRLALGRGELDFSAPAGEPNGTRIALRSDRDQESGTSDVFADILSPLDVFLFDPVAGAATALTPVPGSTIDSTLAIDNGAPRWQIDGSALFVHSDGPLLSRHTPPNGPAQAFVASEVALAATVDPGIPVEDVALGTHRDACRLHPLPELTSTSVSRLVVNATCTREVVNLFEGQHRWEQANIFPLTRLRVMEVVPSTQQPGSLDGHFTARFDLGTSHVVSCDGASCAEPGTDTPAGSSEESSARASPDGTKIAFLRDPSLDGDLSQAIYVADLATNEIRLVMPAAHGDVVEGSLAWSPDARWLAFVLADPEPVDVFVVPADADAPQSPRRMTRDLDFAISLSWYSPLRLVGP